MRLSALVTARWSLRTYWRSAAVLAVAAGLGLAGVLVVASWVLPHYPALAPRFGVARIAAWDTGQPWSDLARFPTSMQWEAMIGLFQALVAQTGALVIVATLTVIGVSVARARGRRDDVAVRRAVGAKRRTVVASALAEIGVVTAVALLAGGFAAAAWSRAALHEWHGIVWPAAGTPVIAVIVCTFILLGVDAALTAAPAWRRVLAPPLSTTPGLAVAALQLGLSVIGLAAGDVFAHRVAAVGGESATSAASQMYALSSSEALAKARAASYTGLLTELGAKGNDVSLESPGTRIGLGVTDAAVADCGRCWMNGTWSDKMPLAAQHFLVSPDTFRMLNVRVVSGRGITAADRLGAEPVAVISESVEHGGFQRPAVGRKIRIAGQGRQRWYTVVGVVSDRVPEAFGGGDATRQAIYLSVLQHPAAHVEALVRPRAGAASTDVASAARAAGVTATPEGSDAALLTRQTDPLRWFARAFRAEGWLMLAAAWFGTAALMLVWVHSIRRELGIRRAVGATRARVIGYVLLRALAVAVAGVLVARWLGDIVWMGITAVVPGVPDLSWDTVARLSVLLGVTAVAAATLPAWHAARVSPAALSDAE